jgi:hypothetical protein
MKPIAMAWHLADNIPAIARHPDAGKLLHDVRYFVDRIENRINRPQPDLFLGPCPTLVGKRQECATQLRADRKATEVVCPKCKHTHGVDHLKQLLHNALRYHPMSSVEILGNRASDLPGALEQLGDHLPRSNFYFWCKNGKLYPRAYRTKLGATMPYRETDSDTPLYWLADVWNLMGIHQENDDTPDRG